ncbi:lipid A deacylase LpxR family protein [Lysobacter niastensis]|uniref:Lipid A deacylase LpxR family protein n=1 Tax=Lysobacter niastensis TaxID=380629 RepID=A0ABS0B949_9GAMM|nr:lipid A deacylase LpxR family protein [Lysobacter niastensis]MBF6025448.1 lipid A deacylase LpxR family protein [Lysobacter niastensis]
MHSDPVAKWLQTAAALSLCLFLPAQAQGREACTSGRPRPIINLRVDNDMAGGQDQGYTNGVQLTLVSPNLRDYTDDPCIPRLAKLANRYLGVLHPKSFDQLNMISTLTHRIYTPTDFSRSELIEDDRPYAGVLVMGSGYNAREGDQLRTTQLQVGIVGPAAMGKQAQNGVHQLIGADKFRGWGNQLENELVFRLVHERMRRFSTDNGVGGWGWDTIAHYGGSFGNLATYLNTGAEFRFGVNLPDDFGSTPMRPAGENTAPTRDARSQYVPGAHLFVTFDTRWVLLDITLDGNTWRDSPSVDKRHVVANLGYGVVLMRHRWKFALARYHGTREFDGQQETPVFGSLTVSHAF